MSELCVKNSSVAPAHGIRAYLPAAKPKTVTAGDCEPSDGSLTILVAEDESVCRLFLSRILAKLGHEVRSVKNGREVLELLLGGEQIDLLLTDIQMPLIDGLELAGILRSDKRYRRHAGLPIVAMTAYPSPGAREQFLKAGMDDYLPKPIDGRLLELLIARVADQAK